MSLRVGCNLDYSGRDGSYCTYSSAILRRKARQADYFWSALKSALLRFVRLAIRRHKVSL